MREKDCCIFVFGRGIIWGSKPSLLGRDGGQEQTRQDKARHEEKEKKEVFIHLFT